MFAFQRLEAWRRCHDLTLAIYRITRDWPRHEQYGLTSQVRRAAVSAEANIAEGAAKRGSKEFRRYLDISVGTLSELACLLLVARDLGYLQAEHWKQLEPVRSKASRVTWRLYQAIAQAVPAPEISKCETSR